jgi:hypothetical protein
LNIGAPVLLERADQLILLNFRARASAGMGARDGAAVEVAARVLALRPALVLASLLEAFARDRRDRAQEDAPKRTPSALSRGRRRSR